MYDDGWKVEEITGVAGVRHALVFSADGLVKIRSSSLDRDEADRLAAACSGLHGLGHGMSVVYDRAPEPGVQQVMVQFGEGFLFVRSAGEGSRLAVVTEAVIDPALIAQQMALQVARIGAHALATPARTESTP